MLVFFIGTYFRVLFFNYQAYSLLKRMKHFTKHHKLINAQKLIIFMLLDERKLVFLY